MGEKEWYFFCQRDRKYPTGTRTNRATEAGYWKATGKDRGFQREKFPDWDEKDSGFPQGRAPRGEKTNWVMHEYRLEGKLSYHDVTNGEKAEWVVCRVFHKNSDIKKSLIPDHLLKMNSFGHELMDYASLPPLMEPTLDCENEFKDINNASNHPHIIFHQGTNSDSFPDGFRTDDDAILRALAANNSTGDIEHRQCKTEQFSSNQSMVSLSQDIGVGIDINNNEISSVISNSILLGSCKSYDDDDIENLVCLWN